MSLKEKFMNDYHSILLKQTNPKYLIVAVKLPTGAVEIITNTENIESKCDYYRTAYDKDFKLVNNPQIEIVNYMIV